MSPFNVIHSLPSPIGMSRAEILDLLLREEYGILPTAPRSVTGEVIRVDKKFCAGKAPLQTIRLHCKAEWGDFSFPVYYVCPAEKQNVPCFIHINFRDMIPDRYQPTEELVDAGYATLTFCYKDVTSDDGDFTNGLAGVLYPDGKHGEHDCGKIGMWAWAAGAVLQYAKTLPALDHDRMTVIGHSRLGKTALLVGALHPEVYCAISNDSGCSGAALSRNKQGETIADIIKTFPYWFCENYRRYVDREDALPFDQHFLIAANAPHRVYVASAEGDKWADPEKEYLACVAASGYYEAQGLKGFVCPDRLPDVGESFHEGNIGYHLRSGLHYLSRDDWRQFLHFLSKASDSNR